MPPSKSKRKKKILSKPEKIEPSFPISAEIANLDSTITIDHNLYINHGYHECMSKCKELCKFYESMNKVSDTVSCDSGKGKLLNQRKNNKNGLRDDMAINKQSCNKERHCANEKENVRMTNKVQNVSDTKYMVPWSRKELLDNLDIRYVIPENRQSGFGGLEKMIINIGNDAMKMCPYTPNGMKKQRDFNNRFVRLNQFELPKDNIQYGINLVNVRKNFLNAVFPDIVKIENKSFWRKMFGGEDDKEITENEPSLFAIRLLEIISTKRYQKPFLTTPIKHKKYSSRLNELIENSFLENIEFIEYHELFIICLLYIQKHLKGIIKREFYECLNVVASEKSGRIYLFLNCIPYVLGNLKYSMMMNLFKCLIGYAGEFNVSQEYVFERTCRYLVDEKVNDVRHEPIIKLCNIMMKDQQKT